MKELASLESNVSKALRVHLELIKMLKEEIAQLQTRIERLERLNSTDKD